MKSSGNGCHQSSESCKARLRWQCRATSSTAFLFNSWTLAWPYELHIWCPLKFMHDTLTRVLRLFLEEIPQYKTKVSTILYQTFQQTMWLELIYLTLLSISNNIDVWLPMNRRSRIRLTEVGMLRSHVEISSRVHTYMPTEDFEFW
jgi:hypothetical protein